MFVVLAILHFARPFIYASPLPAPLTATSSIPDNLISACVCVSERSIWDIVWSCLATIFACTWVSMHPNIPGHDEQWWKLVLRRLELMLWALISPELIIMWAMRQWAGARKLQQRYGGLGWTKTHGYFLQMGGFVLVDGNEEKGVLTPEMLMILLTEGKIDFPTITEKEIQDRSKGDGLSKGIAIAQTTWFVAQCISRKVQGLVTTELEIATLAFAVLNAVVYFLWWNKPQGVTCPVPIYLLPNSRKPVEIPSWEVKKWSQSLSDTFLSSRIWFYTRLNHSVDASEPPDHKSELVELSTLSAVPPLESDQNRKSTSGGSAEASITPNAAKKTRNTIVYFPVQIVLAIAHRLDDMIDSDKVENGAMQVPTFYAHYSLRSHPKLFNVVTVIGALFGGIHCLGWDFTFPSHTELVLWRVCSSIIASVPLHWLLVISFANLRRHKRPSVADIPLISFTIFAFVGLPLYIFARIGLLVEALITLRALPPGAYAKVQWTSFLPHI